MIPILTALTLRPDASAALRDAPVPVHACVNHVEDGHCRLCGERVAPAVRGLAAP